MNQEKAGLGLFSSLMIVVTTVIGAGIFTTTGYFASDLGSPWAVLLTWVVTAVIAILSALSIAELGAMIPKSGGDYMFVRRAFSSRISYLFGVISGPAAWTVGTAFVAGTLGKHLNNLIPQVPQVVGASLAILILVIIHLRGVKTGAIFNNTTTLLKIFLILGFVIAGLGMVLIGDESATFGVQQSASSESPQGWRLLEKIFYYSIFAQFAFAGYNALVLMAGEVRDPGKNIPRSLIYGLGGVALLYLLVTLVFVLVTHPADMVGPDGKGIADLGTFTADRLFGEGAAKLFDVLFVLILISTLSSCIQVSARISWRMACEGQLPTLLGRSNKHDAPANALMLQAVLLILAVVFLERPQLLLLNGMCTLLLDFPLALAIFRLRRKEPDTPRPFRVPLYPWVPMVRIVLAIYVGYVFIIEDRWNGPLAFGLIVLILMLQPLLVRGKKESPR